MLGPDIVGKSRKVGERRIGELSTPPDHPRSLPVCCFVLLCQSTRQYRIAFVVPICIFVSRPPSQVSRCKKVEAFGRPRMAQGVEMPGARAHNEILGQFHLSLSHDEVHNTLCGMHWRHKGVIVFSFASFYF